MLELQRLFDDLEAAAAPRSSGLTMMEAIGDDRGGGGSWLSSLFGPGDAALSSGADSAPAGSLSAGSSAPPKKCTPGIYMYGGVGTGKTMLMDVFSECVSPLVPVSLFFLFFCFFFSDCSPLFSLFVSTGKNPTLCSSSLCSSSRCSSFPPSLSFRNDEIKLKTTIAVQSEGGPRVLPE